MAVFKFKLGTMLRIKERLEKSAKHELGIASMHLEAEKRAFEAISTHIGALRDDFTASVSGSINPVHIKNLKSFIELRKQDRRRQDEVVKEATLTVDKIRDRVVVLMQERKMLDKLREKNLEIFRQEGIKEEQHLVDELVTYRGRTGKNTGED